MKNEAGLISQLRVVDNTAEAVNSSTNGRCTKVYPWTVVLAQKWNGRRRIEPKPCGIAE